MGLELFHEVPAGAIEMLFDDQNQPLFKRADLGKYLGIRNTRDNFKDFPSHYTRLRSEIEGVGSTNSLGRTKNPHDIFINLDGSIEIAAQSKKCKAVTSIKWLTKKGVEKIQEHQQAITYHDNQIQALDFRNEKHQQATEEKDAVLALLTDDLQDRNNEIQAIQYDNVALQRQKDVYQAELQKCQDTIARLRTRHVPHAKNLSKDNIIIIVWKHTTSANDKYHGLPCYVVRI